MQPPCFGFLYWSLVMNPSWLSLEITHLSSFLLMHSTIFLKIICGSLENSGKESVGSYVNALQRNVRGAQSWFTKMLCMQTGRMQRLNDWEGFSFFSHEQVLTLVFKSSHSSPISLQTNRQRIKYLELKKYPVISRKICGRFILRVIQKTMLLM